MGNETTKETVIEALKQVVDPEKNQSIVALNMVDFASVCEDKVKVDIILPATDYVHREAIFASAKQAILELDGIQEATVGISLKTPAKNKPFQRPADKPTAPVAAKQLLPNIKNVIAISSGKGGVGKTSVSVNLACALSQLGYKVGIVDADIYGPNVPIMMGLRGEKITQESESGKPMPPENYGIKVISVAFLIKEEKPVVWRGPLLDRIIRQFLSDFEWGELDFLLVDLPPGTGDAQLTIMQAAALSGAVIVTTPQEVALHDSRKGLAMFTEQKIPCLGIIENMSYFLCNRGERYEIFGHGGGKAAAKALGVPFLGELPLVIEQRAEADDGKPIVIASPDSDQAERFRGLSTQLIENLKQAQHVAKHASGVPS
ncbi:MAG: Mrp/NBP35 family ATP-binding protein [Cyanobacteria bacterium P01_H01_bin.74]